MRPLCLTAALLVATLHAGAGAAQAARSVVSELRTTAGADRAPAAETLVSRSLHRLTDFNPEAVPLLLEIESTHRVHGDDEGFDGQTVARAFGWDGSAFSRALWSYRGEGQRAAVLRNTYVAVTRLGCCAVDDTHTLVYARDGQVLLTYTDQPLFAIDSTGAQEVVVALRSPTSYDIPESLATDPQFRGILQLAHPGGARDALMVRVAADEDLLWPVVARCDDAGRVILGEVLERTARMNVCLQLRSGGWLVVPVAGHRFQLSSAALPPGVRLERLP